MLIAFLNTRFMKICKYLSILISISFCWTTIYTQSETLIDSLLSELENVDKQIDTHYVDLLNELAWQYRKKDIDKALEYATQSLEHAMRLQYLKGEADAYNRLGVIYKNKNQYDKAIGFYEKGLNIRKIRKDSEGVANTLLNIGNIQKRKRAYRAAIASYEEGISYLSNSEDILLKAKLNHAIGTAYKNLSEYEPAIQYLLQSLELRKKLNDEDKIAVAYQGLGGIFEKQENYEQALSYYLKSQDIFEKKHDSIAIANGANNLGNINYYLNNTDKALAFYLKALNLYPGAFDLSAQAFIYSNIGVIYEEKLVLDSAMLYQNKALEIRSQLEDKKGIASSNYKLGNLQRIKGDYSKAIEHYQIAYDNATIVGDKFLEMEIAKQLSQSHQQLQNYEVYYKFNNRFIELKDSLHNSDKSAMNYMLRYLDEQNKRAELAKHKIELEQEKLLILNRQNRIQFAAVIAILLSIFVVFFNRQRSKLRLASINSKLAKQSIDELLKEQELKSTYAKLQGQDSEKQRIARDLHDSLGGTLATVKLLFQSIQDNLAQLKEDTIKQYHKANHLLEEAYEEVRRISYDMQSGLLTNFGLVSQLKELAESIESTKKLEIAVLAFGLDKRLDMKLEIELYKIIQELVSNVLKHADAEELSIQLNRQKENLNLLVEDDGVGFDINAVKNDSGQGLRNVDSRVFNLGGSLSIDSGKGGGTTICIDIPL